MHAGAAEKMCEGGEGGSKVPYVQEIGSKNSHSRDSVGVRKECDGGQVKGFLGVLSHFTQQQYSNAVTTERGFQRKLYGVAASLVNFLSGRRLYPQSIFFDTDSWLRS